MGERAHCALFRINVNIYNVYTYTCTYARNNNDDPLPHAARIELSVRITRRDFEGGDNSRCGEISRKYGS